MMYRKDGMVFVTFTDSVWQNPKFARILPTSTSWGIYQELSNDPLWIKLIPQVTLEILDRSHRGDCTPLMNAGVREPYGCLKLLNIPKPCAEKKVCLTHKDNLCVLGHKNMPDCFVPQADNLITPLIRAWRDGYRIVREAD